jgi:hypothetical protein
MAKFKIILKQFIAKRISFFVNIREKLLSLYISAIESLKNLTKRHGTRIFILLEIGVMSARLLLKEKTNCLEDQEILQNFIEWFGIIYALVLTIIVDQCRNKYNKLNHQLDREADALALLFQTGEMFPIGIWRVALLESIKSYATAICELKTKDQRNAGKAYEKMKTIHECIIGLTDSTKKIDSCIKSELLHEYNEAYDARGDRFDLINQRLPGHVWIILGFVSLLWLWGFLLLDIHSTLFRNYILGATTLSISYLFYLARDLDNPYGGQFVPNFNSFEQNFLK